MASLTLLRRFNRRPFLRPPAAAYLLSTSSTPHSSTFRASEPPLSRVDVLEKLKLQSNDWKTALDYFKSVSTEQGFRHTTETLNCMVDILGKFFEFDLSWKLIEGMSKSGYLMPDHTTFRVLFKRYISARLVEEAFLAYERSGEFNLKDETCYSYLVDALCEYKHVEDAEEFVFGKKKTSNNDVIAVAMASSTKIHNMILRGWYKKKWWGKCKEFWEKMDRKGVNKDLHSYSIYMDIMCKSGKPYRAVKLFKEMKGKRIQLDVVAYNTAILAMGLSKGVDSATSVYREMREMGCPPNVVTCNTVIKLLCENSRMEEAYEMLDKMGKEGIHPDEMTYRCFYRSLGDPKEILQLFDRMLQDGVEPTMNTFVMLIKKFGRWGFLRPANIVWSKMLELGYSPDESAYNAWIDALIDKGDKDLLDLARKYDQEMQEKGLSAKPRKEFRNKEFLEG
ncbi:Pentatricopeptide repeat-containing protein At1g80550, mitochondrial [Linum perenne]